MNNRTHKFGYTCVASLRLTFISVFLFFFPVHFAEAKNPIKNEIVIITPNDSSQYTQVVSNIRKNLRLNNNIENVKTLYLSDFATTGANLNNKKLVVLVGSSAFSFYSKSNATSPYLATLITKSAFEYIHTRANNKNNFIGGIMIDQPARRYINFTHALLPTLKTTGIVIGPEKIKYKQKILEGVDKKGINLNFVEISLNDNPVNKLRNAYESNQALIVFPDRKKFNRSLSRWILTLSYQYKIPLISYSKKYAEAGALASLFTTPEKIGTQTAEMIIPFLQNPNNKNRKLVYPKYFDIHVNHSVAKALSINIPSKSELLRKISK